MSKIGIDGGGGGTGSSITLMGNTGSISGTSFTISGSGVLSSAATGSTVAFTSTAANVIHSSSGDATASSNAFTVVGAGNITTSATGSTLTITGSSFFTWNEVTGTTQSASVNNGYIANNAGLVTVTLPSTAALGSLFRISGKGTGGWKIAQNSGQTIFFGTSTTTTGVVGNLSSTARRDSIELVCVTANNDWNVLSAQGNISIT